MSNGRQTTQGQLASGGYVAYFPRQKIFRRQTEFLVGTTATVSAKLFDLLFRFLFA